MTESALLNSIAEELNTELSSQPMYSAEIVALKVKDAYRKVRARRCYENTFTTGISRTLRTWRFLIFHRWALRFRLLTMRTPLSGLGVLRTTYLAT